MRLKSIFLLISFYLVFLPALSRLEAIEWSPIQVSLGNPLFIVPLGRQWVEWMAYHPLQIIPQDADINGLRISALQTINRNVRGLDVGVFPVTTESVSGIQIGFGCLVEEDMKGICINGFGSGIRNKMSGLQLSPIMNIANQLKGIQIATGNLIKEDGAGVQIAIGANDARGGYRVYR